VNGFFKSNAYIGIGKVNILCITNLHSGFAEIKSHGQLLPGEDIRILRLLKRPLQLMQLVGGEGGAAATYFARLVHVIAVVGAATAHVTSRVTIGHVVLRVA